MEFFYCYGYGRLSREDYQRTGVRDESNSIKNQRDLIHKFVSELTKYYGEPDISDEKEDSYHWYLPSGLAVRARHLHAPDGGWTVYFYY